MSVHRFVDSVGLVITVETRTLTHRPKDSERSVVIDIRADHPDILEPQEIAIWADDADKIIELLQKAKEDSKK